MALNICKYIQDCLLYTKLAIITWFIALTLIQTRESYELMRINFIGLFENSTYKNTYIYNLVDYFFKHIYPYPTSSAGGEDII